VAGVPAQASVALIPTEGRTGALDLLPRQRPQNPTTVRHRVLLALSGDIAVLAVFLYIALGQGSSAGEPAQGQALAEESDVIAVEPAPAPSLAVDATPGPGNLKAAIEDELAGSSTEVGVVVLDADGNPMLSIDAGQSFVLASVAKVYILVTYLDQLEQRGKRVSESDLALLQPMIRASDNTAASTLWKRIGETEGLTAFLASRGLTPVVPVEDEKSWGTLKATPEDVAVLLLRLANGQLLGPESTQLAMRLLSEVNYDQAWGVSAGVTDPDADIYLKNGWYPESDGWRVNSAGVIRNARGEHVLVILTYPSPSMDDGVALIEAIATQINRFISN
jgi:beta-lactamase class A